MTGTRGRVIPSVVRERGSVTVEFVLLAPVFVAFLCFVVGVGRLAEAHGQVVGAARDAARAASIARSPDEAVAAARDTARADVTAAGLTCRNLNVQVNTGRFTPGGVVSVRVTCTTGLADVTISGLPGAKTMSADATAPLDTYRAVQP